MITQSSRAGTTDLNPEQNSLAIGGISFETDQPIQRLFPFWEGVVQSTRKSNAELRIDPHQAPVEGVSYSRLRHM
jgi:hypothetical protein